MEIVKGHAFVTGRFKFELTCCRCHAKVEQDYGVPGYGLLSFNLPRGWRVVGEYGLSPVCPECRIWVVPKDAPRLKGDGLVLV